MIYTREHLRHDQILSVDVCVIGSGAGGAAAAFRLASAGKRVVVLESGSFLAPTQFNQREEEMFPRLFYSAGGRRTADRAIRVLHGHGVGGSTLHNINLCKRAPDALVASWGLKRLTPAVFNRYAEEVERLLGVARIPDHQVNSANRLFQRGVERLGYRGGRLSHNREGCVGSGFCELGCSFDAKLNALRVLIPEAVGRGAQVLADTRALRIEWRGRKAVAVHAEVASQARIKIEARAIVCAGGAIETPALLLRSQVPDPRRLVGSRLYLHPGVVAAGVFEEKVECWRGVPQSYECTQFLDFDDRADKRIWIIPGSAHPAGAASLLPGFGDEHSAVMKLFPNFAPLSAMVHDRTSGRVSLGGTTGVSIDYSLEASDRAQLSTGLKECTRILLAAGAREVILPLTRPIRIRSESELPSADLAIRDLEIDIVSVHPMSSVWMGSSPESSPVEDTGRYHQLENLFIADTSLYPTSLGVPPQISTYALGLYTGDSVINLL